MLRALVLLLPALLLTACSERDDGFVRISLIAAPEDAGRAGKPPFPTAIRAATAEGLVGFDAEGRVVPALADRWIVTDDGQSYIFRLRNGVWPGGGAITAETAAAALRMALRGTRGSPLALDLAAIAEIRPMAARVIEIRLSSPLPDLLALLAQPELGLLRKGKGSGPMALERQGAIVQLEPIPPEKRGLPAQEGWAARTRILRVRVEPAREAIARFDEGYADVVLGGRTDTLPLVDTAGLSRGTVRLDPVIGLFGLLVLDARGFLETSENREALALAIDREALLAPFKVAGWTPTSRIVPPDLDSEPGTVGERWADIAFAERRSIAAERVAAWKAAAGGSLKPIRVALPATPGATFIYDRLRADWEAVGVTIVRVGENEAADLRLLDRVARYGRAVWFLNQLSCAANRPACSAEGDARIQEAHTAPDPQARAALLAEAEARITAANGFIPFARPLRWSLVRADVTGFAINPWATHPLLPMARISR